MQFLLLERIIIRERNQIHKLQEIDRLNKFKKNLDKMKEITEFKPRTIIPKNRFDKVKSKIL